MKNFLANLRSTAVAGFLFLLPLYILLVIFTKAWASLSSLGTRLAGMFGLKSILGLGGSTVLSGLLLIFLWLVCGLLVRFSFVDAFSKTIERWLSKFILGYSKYKALADEKVHHGVKILPYSCALIRPHEYWQPAYVIEEDGHGNYVMFLPETPDTSSGSVLLATRDQLKFMSGITANQLDVSLKKMGKGLLSEYGIRQQ
jgi:uncharacterized membrane protein